MKKVRFFLLWLSLILIADTLAMRALAASVGPTGYTNSFTTQPVAADWSTFTITGAAADIGTPAQLDAAVELVPASSITTALTSDTANPPAAGAVAVWSSTGGYVQTRPTSVGAILMMCTLVNNIGTTAGSVTLSYDFAQVAPLLEEIDGHRVYYSLTGAAGSWTNIPALS